MKVITRVKDGVCVLDIIDASDNTTVRSETVEEGQQVAIVATTASSAADLEVYGPEAIPEAEAESAESGQGEGEGEAQEGSTAGSQPGTTAEGAEEPADAGGTPAEGEEPTS
jgi:hypothetical protein